MCRCNSNLKEKHPVFYNSFFFNHIRILIISMSPDFFTTSVQEGGINWNMEDELQRLLRPYDARDSEPPIYPFHLMNLDDSNSLTLALKFKYDDWIWNYKCEAPITKSFKVFLHRPDEMKLAFDRPFEVEVGRKTLVAIKPHVITTSKYVKKYSPQLRQCFYSSERSLKFFRLYTKSNCEHECLANFTKIECGCVKFSMPREQRSKFRRKKYGIFYEFYFCRRCQHTDL